MQLSFCHCTFTAADVLSVRLCKMCSKGESMEGILIDCLTNHSGGNELHFPYELKEHVKLNVSP